jgi:Tfp pilus assembly protein PilZ
MTKKGMEKRLFPRRLIRTKVTFEDEFGDGLIYLFSEDISLGGIFLSDRIPIKIGSYTFLSFDLPGSNISIKATGQVVRVLKPESKEGSNGGKGVGIRFVGLSEKAVQAIQEYVS